MCCADPLFGDDALFGGACRCHEGLGDGVFSDAICFHDDCVLGDNLVKSLVQWFDANHRPKKWEPAVMALYGEWEKVKGIGSAGILNEVGRCCQVRKIGERAQQLKGQIAKDLGTPAGPVADTRSVVDQSVDGSWLQSGLKVLAVAAVAGVVAYSAMKGRL